MFSDPGQWRGWAEAAAGAEAGGQSDGEHSVLRQAADYGKGCEDMWVFRCGCDRGGGEEPDGAVDRGGHQGGGGGGFPCLFGQEIGVLHAEAAFGQLREVLSGLPGKHPGGGGHDFRPGRWARDFGP